MNDPLVSFIIPTFNRETLLAAAIESILAEGYARKEIVVVDDGSSDGTAELCSRRPVIYLRQENRGVSAARNLGVAKCGGELLVFLDDDDLCSPGSLSTRVRHWQEESAKAHIIGRLRRFHETAGKIEFLDAPGQARHWLCMGAELMRRDTFEAVGGFNETLRIGEDIDLWARLREAGFDYKAIPEVCLFYRRHKRNASHDTIAAGQAQIRALHLKLRRDQQRASAKP